MRRPCAVTIPSLLVLAALALAATAGPAASGPPVEPLEGAALAEEHRAWLEEVELLLSEEERAAFLGLGQDYRREAFIERFWERRDPFPETGLNEFRESWNQRVEEARARFGGLRGDRARVLLLNGPPLRLLSSPCPRQLKSSEIWIYEGERRGGGRYAVVLLRRGGSPDGYRLWSPLEGIASLLLWPEGALTDRGALEQLARICPRASDIVGALATAVDWERQVTKLGLVPRPSPEWVSVFLARSTVIPAGAPRFEGEFQVAFPGRRQSRTAVQGLVTVPRSGVGVAGEGEARGYRFLVDGEILRQERIFDSFRYRFDLPLAAASGERIPLLVERYLRPGAYTLVLRVRDLASDRFFRVESDLRVPALSRRAEAKEQRAPGLASAPPAPPAPAVAPAAEPAAEPRSADPFAEANAPLAGRQYRVKILPLPERLLTGRQRVEAVASGGAISKVAFHLDGRAALAKTRPPFSVELDLGHAPRLHDLEAIAFDRVGRELARDRLRLNAGPHRFAVRLLEPRPGRRFRESLRIEAEVSLPAGETLDRLELYFNETLLATLYQPPFVQPLRLPRTQEMDYVRAVAYLADGNTSEDLVVINAPAHLERLDVDFVELYASVRDRGGRLVTDLEAKDFTVFEDGAKQRIRRLDRVRDLPIHAGVMLDCSTSMAEEIRQAQRAALRFFERVIQPDDRAAVILFNNAPELKVPFTNNLEVLAGGLATVAAEGETALYDSLVFSLYYFAGIRGKRALILLSDGRDSISRHSFKEALEFARRTGTAIYTVGLDVDHREVEARNVLLRLARDTGGRSFFIERAAAMEKIYQRIEDELRSQYLIAYQSSQLEGDDFREVEVRVHRPGLTAATIPGYYP